MKQIITQTIQIISYIDSTGKFSISEYIYKNENSNNDEINESLNRRKFKEQMAQDNSQFYKMELYFYKVQKLTTLTRIL